MYDAAEKRKEAVSPIEAANRANGCNSAKFVEESVTVEEVKNARNSPWMNKSSSFRKAPVMLWT